MAPGTAELPLSKLPGFQPDSTNLHATCPPPGRRRRRLGCNRLPTHRRVSHSTPSWHPHACLSCPRQVVLIELCAERKPILTVDKIQEPSLSEVVAEIRSGRATPFQGVYSW